MIDHSQDSEHDLNLVDLAIALGYERWILLIVTLTSTLIGIVLSLVTPPAYLSRTSVIVNQQSSTAGSAGLAALSGLTGLSGLSGLSGITGNNKSSDELFIALMRSETVQTSLIARLKLKERYGSRTMEDARIALSSNANIMVDKKSGLLVIEAQDKEPDFAALLANEHVKELNVILSRLAVTEAQKRRAYYEQQIIKTQAKIPQLELEFKEAQRNSGLEVASLMSESGTLPGQIAAKELQRQVLSRFATEQNPELKRLSLEISALRSQLARYEISKGISKTNELSKTGQQIKPENSNTETSNAIQKAIQAYNTLKIQEALLDGFVKQFELAKVDESKEGPSIQVVDEAKPAEMRSKPERKKMVIAFTVTGFFVSLILAALRAFMRHVSSTPEGRMQLSQLKRAWGLA